MSAVGASRSCALRVSQAPRSPRLHLDPPNSLHGLSTRFHRAPVYAARKIKTKTKTVQKTMKNNQSSSGPRASVSASTSRPFFGQSQSARRDSGHDRRSESNIVVDLELRHRRRHLSSSAVFDLLRHHLPLVFPLARAIRGLVSVTFPSAPARPVRARLSELGFSWNYDLRCWQHPCGRFTSPSGQPAGS